MNVSDYLSFHSAKCINNSNVTLREYNDLMEENITIKLEATRLSTAIAHLEETNIKLESKRANLFYRRN